MLLTLASLESVEVLETLVSKTLLLLPETGDLWEACPGPEGSSAHFNHK